MAAVFSAAGRKDEGIGFFNGQDVLGSFIVGLCEGSLELELFRSRLSGPAF
jgi:hypothetical protein